MAREFQRGHKAKISDLTAGTDLYVGVQIAGPGLTFDISCFGLDADERLSDDRYFIFFNQPKSPEESIQLLGAQAGDTESFRVTLDRIPAQIQKLSFTADARRRGPDVADRPRLPPDRRGRRGGRPLRLRRLGVHHRARRDAGRLLPQGRLAVRRRRPGLRRRPRRAAEELRRRGRRGGAAGGAAAAARPAPRPASRRPPRQPRRPRASAPRPRPPPQPAPAPRPAAARAPGAAAARSRTPPAAPAAAPRRRCTPRPPSPRRWPRPAVPGAARPAAAGPVRPAGTRPAPVRPAAAAPGRLPASRPRRHRPTAQPAPPPGRLRRARTASPPRTASQGRPRAPRTRAAQAPAVPQGGGRRRRRRARASSRRRPPASAGRPQNQQLIRVDLGIDGQPVLARQGSMVLYQGKVDFSYKGAGLRAAAIVGNATGQEMQLMRCTGQGQVFLAENARPRAPHRAPGRRDLRLRRERPRLRRVAPARGPPDRGPRHPRRRAVHHAVPGHRHRRRQDPGHARRAAGHARPPSPTATPSSPGRPPPR